MRSVSRRLVHGLAAVLAVGTFVSTTALAADGPAPRYTYFGAGYEWADSKCAYEPQGTRLTGYTVEGSVGVLDFAHLIGAYYDGETKGHPTGLAQKVDGSCLELGAGLSYALAPGADMVLRGYWVRVDFGDAGGFDEDGFEPELLVRYAVSDKVEIQAGMNYYDVGDLDSTEVRLALVYNVAPRLAVRVGGSVFDSDSSLSAGVRAYFGSNLN